MCLFFESPIGTISGLIGAADANDTGGKISEEVATTAGKGVAMTAGAAMLSAKGAALAGKTALGVGRIAGRTAIMAGKFAGKGAVGAGRMLKQAHNNAKSKNMAKYDAKNNLIKSLDGKTKGQFNEDEFRKQAESAGLNKKETNNLIQTVNDSFDQMEYGEKLEHTRLAENYASTDKQFKNTRDEISKNIIKERNKEERRIRFKNATAKIKNSGVGRFGLALGHAGQAVGRSFARAGKATGRFVSKNVLPEFKRYGGGVARDARFIGRGVKKFKDKGPFSFLGLATKDDKFASTFLDKSGIKSKPNFEKETAANTAEIAKNLKKDK